MDSMNGGKLILGKWYVKSAVFLMDLRVVNPS